MTSGGAIVVGSDEFERATRDTARAAHAFAMASPRLRTGIPANAFGAFGYGATLAGNLVGGAIARVITQLGDISTATSNGVRAAQGDFEQVEQDAVARFREIENGLSG